MKSYNALLIALLFIFPTISRGQNNPDLNTEDLKNKNTREVMAIYAPQLLNNTVFDPFSFAYILNQKKDIYEIKQALDSIDIVDDGLVYEKYKNTYNTKGQCVLIEFYVLNESNEMVNYRKMIYTYWPDGKIKDFQVQSWRVDINDWVSFLWIEYTYESSLLMVSRVFSWNVESNEWNFGSKDTYEYDEENRLILITTKTEDSGSWVNHQKEAYSYNDDNDLYLWIGSKWLEQAWVPSDKSEYFFDDNGNRNLIIYSDWMVETEAWLDFQKNTYTYNDDNQQILAISTVFDTEDLQWHNLYKDEYTKDDYDNRLMEIDYLWENESWLQINKEEWVFDYAYPANLILFPEVYGKSFSHMLTQENSFHWNDNTWYPWTNRIYYYSTKEINDIEEYLESHIMIYPNPNNGAFKLEIGPIDLPTTVSIIDLNGSVLRQETLKSSAIKTTRDFDLSDNAKGIYLIKISNAKESITHKIEIY